MHKMIHTGSSQASDCGDSSSGTASASLTKQLEFYFSDANIRKSAFMKQVVTEGEGFLPIEKLQTFNLMKDKTAADIVASAKASALLIVSEDHKQLKRALPFKADFNKSDEIRRTIFVENVSLVDDRSQLEKIFQPYGKINYISIPMNKECGQNKRFAFIEYSTVEAANNALEKFPADSYLVIYSKQHWLNYINAERNPSRNRGNNRNDDEPERKAQHANKPRPEGEEEIANRELILSFTGGLETDTYSELRKHFQQLCRARIAYFSYLNGHDRGYIKLQSELDVKYILSDMQSKKPEALKHISVAKFTDEDVGLYRQLLKDIREITSKKSVSALKANPNVSSNSLSMETTQSVTGNNSTSLGSVASPVISNAILPSDITDSGVNNSSSDVADSSFKSEKKLQDTDKKHKTEKKDLKKEKEKKAKKSKKERKGKDEENHSEKRKHDAEPEQERREGPAPKKTKLRADATD